MSPLIAGERPLTFPEAIATNYGEPLHGFALPLPTPLPDNATIYPRTNASRNAFHQGISTFFPFGGPRVVRPSTLTPGISDLEGNGNLAANSILNCTGKDHVTKGLKLCLLYGKHLAQTPLYNGSFLASLSV